MQGNASVARTYNQLLVGLAPQDRQIIGPDLHPEEFPAKAFLERTGFRSKKIPFIPLTHV
jgi:hypothetical protein